MNAIDSQNAGNDAATPMSFSGLFDNLLNTQINPPQDYWFIRSDGDNPDVKHVFNQNGIYLASSIPPIQKKNGQGEAKAVLYTNAEIYNSPEASGAPHNNIKNKNIVDDITVKGEFKNFLADLILNLPYLASDGLNFYCEAKAEGLADGSRGWGFWNTNPTIEDNNIAWFFQYNHTPRDGSNDSFKFLNGTWAWCQNGYNVSMKKIFIPNKEASEEYGLDENWHRYRIRMNSNLVTFFVDGELVHSVSDINCIPSQPMAFHDWVDNAIYTPNPLQFLSHQASETNETRSNILRNLAIQWGIR